MLKFNSDKNVFITSTDELNSGDMEKYVIENMESFPAGAKFMVICGHHHMKETFEDPTFDTIDIGMNIFAMISKFV